MIDQSGPTPVPILVSRDLLDCYLEYSHQLCLRRNSRDLPPQPDAYTTVARAYNVNNPTHRFSESGSDDLCILTTHPQPDLLHFYGDHVPEDRRAAEREDLNVAHEVLAGQRIHEAQIRRQDRAGRARERELANQERLRVGGIAPTEAGTGRTVSEDEETKNIPSSLPTILSRRCYPLPPLP